MAKMILTAAYVNITGPGDISSYVSKAELVVEVEEKDVTTFGSAGWVEVLGGLKKGGLTLTIKQDIADNTIDEKFYEIFGANAAFEVRLTQASVGTSNPKYTGSVLINKWEPLKGSPGDVAEVEVNFPTSGAVARAVA